MLVATPGVFFALGVSRLLVLAVPAAVIGSYAVAIHAFSQTLVPVLLVTVAAVRTAGDGRRGTAPAALAVALGAVGAFASASSSVACSVASSRPCPRATAQPSA